MKRNGLNTEPCGTPLSIGNFIDLEPLHSTN